MVLKETVGNEADVFIRNYPEKFGMNGLDEDICKETPMTNKKIKQRGSTERPEAFLKKKEDQESLQSTGRGA